MEEHRIKIICAHGNAPNQTVGSLKILQNFIGPLEMESDGNGGLRCPCGTHYPKKVEDE